MLQTPKRPRMTAPGVKLVLEKSWDRKLDDPINCLTVGKPFLEELNEENDILIGSTNGKILILNEEKVSITLCLNTEVLVQLRMYLH